MKCQMSCRSTLTVRRIPASPARAATAVLTRPRHPAVPLLVRIRPPYGSAPTSTTSAHPLPHMRCSSAPAVVRSAGTSANRRRRCRVRARPVPPRAASRAATAAVLPVGVVRRRGGRTSAMSCGAGQRQRSLRSAGAATAQAAACPQHPRAQAALRVLPPRVVKLVRLVLWRGEGEATGAGPIDMSASGSEKLEGLDRSSQ